jgi:hypothetical protein
VFHWKYLRTGSHVTKTISAGGRAGARQLISIPEIKVEVRISIVRDANVKALWSQQTIFSSNFGQIAESSQEQAEQVLARQRHQAVRATFRNVKPPIYTFEAAAAGGLGHSKVSLGDAAR